MERGRPSSLDSTKNRKNCQDAFNKGLSVLKTAENLKLDKNTVSKYFIEFREKLVDGMDRDFVHEQKVAKQMAMKKLEDAIEEIDSAIKIAFEKSKHDESATSWYAHYIKCMEIKVNFEQQRYAIEMAPTIDVSIEKIIEEGMEEVYNADTTSSKHTT
jgi:predicted transcriptional regulator